MFHVSFFHLLAMSPVFINLLNDDLLTEIFYLSRKERPLSRFIDTHDFPPMEMTVSHVSQRWRSLALGLSTLWSKILIAQQTAHTKFPLDMAVVYLHRCGTAPLVARVELTGETSPKFAYAFSLLLSKMNSWAWLSIRFSAVEGYDKDIFEALRGAGPSALEYLSITSDACIPHPPQDRAASSQDSSFQAFFSGSGADCSKLKTLRLSRRALCFQPPPLHTITTLHLGQAVQGRVLGWTGIQDILAQCLHLANLSLEETVLDGRDWLLLNPPTVFLPSLRSLRLCGVTGEIYSGLLMALSAPLLECLLLKKYAPGSLDLERFLTACNPLLKPAKFPLLDSVVLDNGEFDVPTYERWFHTFPETRHITVIDSPMKSLVIMDLLSGSVNSQNTSLTPGFFPCPKLESLTLLLGDQDPAEIADAAERRLALGSPLRKVRLGIGFDVKKEEEADIKRLLCRFIPEVQLFREVDPWPSELRHRDEDDFWYFD